MEQTEIFKTIPNSYYQVSTHGSIKVLEYYKQVPNKKPFLVKEHFKKPQNNNSKKYWRVEIRYLDKTKQMCTLHRLVAEAFVPNPDNKPYVNHIDGNKDNNHYSNLEWCTNQENMNHRYTTMKSFNNSIADGSKCMKLTKAEAIEICELLLQGKERKFIAEFFGVSRSTIDMIARGRVWRSLGYFTPQPNKSRDKYFNLRYDPNPVETQG